MYPHTSDDRYYICNSIGQRNDEDKHMQKKKLPVWIKLSIREVHYLPSMALHPKYKTEEKEPDAKGTIGRIFFH